MMPRTVHGARPGSGGHTVGMMSPLIQAAELQHSLGEVTILDVRFRMSGPTGGSAFEAGHVPGAAYVDLDFDLAAPPGEGGRHPLPEPGAFIEAMRGVGVQNDRPVVVYDDWSGHAAARAWWLLRHYGHGEVRLLDGAWPAWLAAGGPVEIGPATSAMDGTFTGEPGGMPVVEVEQVPAVSLLIDARAPERYRGEHEPLDPVAGHIPGAVNVPTSNNLDETGHFRNADELAQVYQAVGATHGRQIAAYCGSGVTAAHDILALELTGVSAALYPGSWSGWVTDPERPVER